MNVLEAPPVTLRPLYDHVFVRRDAAQEKSAGGILLAKDAQEKPIQGTVVACGKGRIDERGTIHPLQVRVNDRVLFSKYEGNEVEINGEALLVMREESIISVLEQAEERSQASQGTR